MKESGQIPEKGGYRLTGGGGGWIAKQRAWESQKWELQEDGPGSKGPWTPAPEFEFTLQAVGMSNV